MSYAAFGVFADGYGPGDGSDVPQETPPLTDAEMRDLYTRVQALQASLALQTDLLQAVAQQMAQVKTDTSLIPALL